MQQVFPSSGDKRRRPYSCYHEKRRLYCFLPTHPRKRHVLAHTSISKAKEWLRVCHGEVKRNHPSNRNVIMTFFVATWIQTASQTCYTFINYSKIIYNEWNVKLNKRSKTKIKTKTISWMIPNIFTHWFTKCQSDSKLMEIFVLLF